MRLSTFIVPINVRLIFRSKVILIRFGNVLVTVSATSSDVLNLLLKSDKKSIPVVIYTINVTRGYDPEIVSLLTSLKIIQCYRNLLEEEIITKENYCGEIRFLFKDAIIDSRVSFDLRRTTLINRMHL